MQQGNTSVFGIYASRNQLEQAIGDLKAAGFRYEDISILLPSPDSEKELAHTNTTKLPEGAVLGGGTGAAIGGVLGWLAGIGSIAIPGAGPFIAAGPIMGLLSGLGVGGAVGSIAGALAGLGVPEYEAVRYEGRLKSGGFLLSVHADDSEWTDRARAILESTGAEDISAKHESSSTGSTKRTEKRAGNF